MYTIGAWLQAIAGINVWLVVAMSHGSKEGATVEAAATKRPLRTAATTRCLPSDSAVWFGPRTNRHLIDSNLAGCSNIQRPGGAGSSAPKALGLTLPASFPASAGGVIQPSRFSATAPMLRLVTPTWVVLSQALHADVPCLF